MLTALHRTLGFLWPTLLVVTGLHVARETGPGEALDGVVSSLWFVALFLAGAIASRRLERDGVRSHIPAPASSAREGVLLGVLTWLAVWAFWALPQTESLRGSPARTFAINCVAALLAGGVRLPQPRPANLAV